MSKKSTIEMSQVKEIPLEKLKPHPRNDQVFKIESENYFQDMSEDMSKNGQLVPIIVDKHNKILAGHNRFKVAQHLKWKTIKAQVVLTDLKNESAEFKFMLSEQLKRRQFGPADRIKAYQMAFPNLAERVLVSSLTGAKHVADENRFGITARQIAEETGVKISTVSNDLVKFRKHVQDLKGITTGKSQIRVGNMVNTAAVSGVKRNCTGIIRATMQENKKTLAVAAEIVQETLNEIKTTLKKKGG